jgi:uncharacterized protein (TIGR02452 family)
MISLMERSKAARLGRETVEIIERGAYTSPSGRTVSIASDLARAIEGTRSFSPFDAVHAESVIASSPTVEVTNESTLEAAQRLAGEGLSPLALNFASAKHPGGGFLGGARAQEESLARSSGLYACLRGHAMYAHHQELRDPMYTSWMIHSPRVPVFRDDAGVLLETSWLCSFLTAPAVNAGVVLERSPERLGAVKAAMAERVEKVLSIAALLGHRELVLGAWGCGVFKNDPEVIAGLFAKGLSDPGRAFSRVIFAILDDTSDQKTRGPFARHFSAQKGAAR